MTCNVTGTAISPNGQIKPGAKITFRRAQLDVVSQEGSFVIPDDYIIQTALDGTVDFNILPGVYDAATVTVGGRTVAFRVSVPDEPAADFADILGAAYVEIPPASVTQAQQARDAAIAARNAAEDARDEAETYADNSAASALDAEAARDASFTNATVYPDIATGRAAVTDGHQFTVVSTGSTEAIRYRRDSSTTQTELARYPLASRVDDLHNRMPSPFNATLMPPESGYVWAVLDAADRLGAGITPDGRLDFVPADGVPQIFPPGVVPATLSSESGWIDACEDASGRVGYGLRVDGTFWARLADDCPVPSWAGGTPSGLLPTGDIVCWGDSMTEGSGASTTNYRYPQALALALGRSVANRGIGGQGSQQIAARQGAVAVTCSVTSNQIPASGTVTVTSISPALLTGGTSTSTRTVTGTLAGVHGTLQKTGYPATYTFTRTTAGSVTSCPPGSAFVTDEAAEFEGHTVVIWAGRNDDRATRAGMIATRDNILAMVDRLTPIFTRVLVLPIFNGRAVAMAGGAYEPSGSTAYANIMLANEELARTMGDRFLGGLRDYMVRYAALDLGLTLTADDLSDIAADCIPRQLFSDDLHLNDYRGVANYVARAIRARGW